MYHSEVVKKNFLLSGSNLYNVYFIKGKKNSEVFDMISM